MTYGTRPIKRHRATKAGVEARQEILRANVAGLKPMTVRQIFYAIPPKRLRDPVRAVIERQLPAGEVAQIRRVEAEDRRQLHGLVGMVEDR